MSNNQRLRDAVREAAYGFDPVTRELCAEIPLAGLDIQQVRLLADTLKISPPIGPSAAAPTEITFRSAPVPTAISEDELTERLQHFRQNVIETVEARFTAAPAMSRFAALGGSHHRSHTVDTSAPSRRPAVTRFGSGF